MSVRFHPSDETLARYAARTLSHGTQIVIAAHVEGCWQCAATVGRFEAVGGALLEEMAETQLDDDSLARTFAKIERTAELERSAGSMRRVSRKRSGGIVLPRALDAYDVGPWRWLGPGIRLSRVKMPDAANSTLILLRVAANKPMPDHGHAGTEYTQVLAGSLTDGACRLLPGDFMEAGEELQHQPMAGPEGECICLAAVDGRLRANGVIGRTYLALLGL